MEITVSTQKGKVPITVVQLHGEVDASNYSQLLSKVEALHKDGARDFLVDLSDVSFMSSAGLVALHSIAFLLRGDKPIDAQTGWDALKSIDRERERGPEKHIKLLSPQPYVADTFEKAGFGELFTVFMDLKKAVASF